MSVVPKLAGSRALARLDAAFAAATDPNDAACRRAERAALLARHGHLDKARAELAELPTQPLPRVAAWVALARGLVRYFSDLDPAARESVQAAYEGSAATRQSALHAMAAAWLAHLDYVQHDIEPMARHLAQALQLAAADDHSTRSRACLVAALGFHHAGRQDLALPWYHATRRHAAAEGDDATLSALMHNMAWLRGNEAREASIFASASPDQVRQALLGAESTGNFDGALRTASLQSLVPILRAQIMVVLDQCSEALALYAEVLPAAMQEGLARMEGFFRADIAWARWRLGQRAAALDEARCAQELLGEDMDVDDRACAHGRLAQVFAALGHADLAAHHQECGEADLHVHRAQQAVLLDALQRGLKGLSPAP
jgi:hypothetical protein